MRFALPVNIDCSRLTTGDSRLAQLATASILCSLIGVAWLKIDHLLIGPALALVPLAGLIVLKQPFPFALGFVLFSFFRLHEVFPQLYSLRIPQLLAMGTLVSLCWSLWSGRLTAYWTRELSIFGLFFLLVTVGLVFASNRGAAIGSFTGNYIKIAIMVVAIAWLATGIRQLSHTARAIIICGILVGAVALFNKMNGIGLVEGTRVTIGRNIGSMLGDPNDLALVLLFPAGFALSYMLNRGMGWSTRILAAIGFVTVVCAVVATQSRGGLLGIAAVTGIFAYRRIKSKALLAAIGAVALMALFAMAGVNDRASGGAHEEGIDESAMGRIHAWGAAIRMALHNPLTGVGLDNFILNYWIYSDFWDGQNHAVHSTWFGVLAETGVLGLVIFVSMMGIILRCVLLALGRLRAGGGLPEGRERWEAYALAEAVLASLAGFTVSGTFLTMGFTWPIYILLALATALGRLSSQMALAASQTDLQSAPPTTTAPGVSKLN